MKTEVKKPTVMEAIAKIIPVMTSDFIVPRTTSRLAMDYQTPPKVERAEIVLVFAIFMRDVSFMFFFLRNEKRNWGQLLSAFKAAHGRLNCPMSCVCLRVPSYQGGKTLFLRFHLKSFRVLQCLASPEIGSLLMTGLAWLEEHKQTRTFLCFRLCVEV